MPKLRYKGFAIFQDFENGLSLGELLFFPSLTTLGDNDKTILTSLTRQATTELESTSSAHWHQLEAHFVLHQDKIQVSIDLNSSLLPSKTDQTLQFHYLFWFHKTSKTWVAYLPSLKIEVLSTQKENLERQLKRHIKATLIRKKALRSFCELASYQICHNLRVQEVTFDVQIPTPKELEEREERNNIGPTPTLKKTAQYLNTKKIQPSYCLETELNRLSDLLLTSHSSVLIVGNHGQGKTALFHELVRQRSAYNASRTDFWATTGSRLVAGMSGFGQWQERCESICQEAIKTDAILHLGNFFELMSVGKSTHNKQGLASFFASYISRNAFRVVIECTPAQLTLLEKEEPKLLASLTQLHLPPIEKGVLQKIITQINKAAAKSYPASLSTQAIDQLIFLHHRYATYSVAPGRQIKFLNYLLRDHQELSLSSLSHSTSNEITKKDVTHAFSQETGLPLFLLDDQEPLHLEATTDWFNQRILGQPQAIEEILNLITTIKTQLHRPQKPLASFLFIGPTGVGKTELAKTLALFFFGSSERMIRFDMSEYSDPLSASRLIGNTYQEEGLLVSRIREQPFCLLLLDEFEKADPLVFDFLLQALGEGRLTDANGREANFCNSIIVMTSNLGAEQYQKGSVGFSHSRQNNQIQDHFEKQVKDFLRPEMFNRIDSIVPFNPFDECSARQVVRRELELAMKREGFLNRTTEFRYTEDLIAWLIQNGFDSRYGARILKRTIEKEVLIPLAQKINYYHSHSSLFIHTEVKTDSSLHHRVGTSEDHKNTNLSVDESPRLAEIQNLRRKWQAVLRSIPYKELENRLLILKKLKLRIQKKPSLSYRFGSRVDSLPKLESLSTSLTHFEEDVLQREEIETLNSYGQSDSTFSSQSPDSSQILKKTPSLTTLKTSFSTLKLQLLSQTFQNPNKISISLFSSHKHWFKELFTSYLSLARSENASWDLYAYKDISNDSAPKEKGSSSHSKKKKQTLHPNNFQPSWAKSNAETYFPFLCYGVRSDFDAERNFPDEWVGVTLSLTFPFAALKWSYEKGNFILKEEELTSKALVFCHEGNIEDNHFFEKLVEQATSAEAIPGRTFSKVKRKVTNHPLHLSTEWGGGAYNGLKTCIDQHLNEKLKSSFGE